MGFKDVCFSGRVNFFFSLALGLDVVIIILMFVMAPSPWYEYDFNAPSGSFQLKVREYLSYSEFESGGTTRTCTYSDNGSCTGDKLNAMFGAIIAFTVLSFISAFVLLVFLVLASFPFLFRDKLGWNFTRYFGVPSIVSSVFLFVFLLLCWTILFQHPAALEDRFDIDCDDLPDSDSPLCSFAGDHKGFEWGPHAGWGIALGSWVLTFPLVAFCVAGYLLPYIFASSQTGSAAGYKLWGGSE